MGLLFVLFGILVVAIILAVAMHYSHDQRIQALKNDLAALEAYVYPPKSPAPPAPVSDTKSGVNVS